MGHRRLSGQVAGEQRWGVLGGIFDPIHYGHLAMADQAREALDLDAVLFVPAGQPVHRDSPAASAEHRLKMIELAIDDNPAFAASRIEIDRQGPSYMVDTLQAMHEGAAKPSLILIVSSETAALMSATWRGVDRILGLAQVAVVNRLGFADITPDWVQKAFPGKRDRFHLLKTSRLGNSATDIRARVAAGKSIRYLVPPAVAAYISEHHLYAA